MVELCPANCPRVGTRRYVPRGKTFQEQSGDLRFLTRDQLDGPVRNRTTINQRKHGDHAEKHTIRAKLANDCGVPARAAPLDLVRRIRDCAILILFAVSCTRSSRKQSMADLSHMPKTAGATEPAILSMAPSLASSEAGAKSAQLSSAHNCLDALDTKLNADTWYDAAAKACHPGATKRDGAVAKATGRDGYVTFDIPAGLGSFCWSAFVIVDQSLLPIQVDILDKQGLLRSLGFISSNRSAVPSFGPFCAFNQDFAKLRLQSATAKNGRVSLAFYVSE